MNKRSLLVRDAEVEINQRTDCHCSANPGKKNRLSLASVWKTGTGFSLLELMVTLVVVAIIASIAIPAYSSYAADTRRSVAIAKLNRIAIALEQYFTEFRNYDTDLQTLQIPAQDNWYEYSIEQDDPMRFRVVATPGQRAMTEIVLGIDQLGRRQQRHPGNDNWEAGWP